MFIKISYWTQNFLKSKYTIKYDYSKKKSNEGDVEFEMYL